MQPYRKTHHVMTRDKKATTAVEFAMILPILILMMFGTIDLGRYYWIRATMRQAIDKVARQAMIASSIDEEALAQIAEDQLIGMDVNDFAMTFDVEPGTPRNYLLIEMDYTFNFTAGMGLLQPSAINLESRVPIKE